MSEKRSAAFDLHKVLVHDPQENVVEEAEVLIPFQPNSDTDISIPYADEEDFTIERKFSLAERKNADLSILIQMNEQDQGRNAGPLSTAEILNQVDNNKSRNLRRNSISMPSGINALEIEALRMPPQRVQPETLPEVKTPSSSVSIRNTI